MGVKDLWTIVQPTGVVESLSSLSGKVIAIDLSCWICESQTVNMGGAVVRPHLRNLFFRAINLIDFGISPIFVLEGQAPEIKWATIQARQGKKDLGKNNSNTGQRQRLKGLLKQCRELLDLLGLPYVQAVGEAEATCAALTYYGIADGVITQDSDVFLYGANTAYRNFIGNKQKATVDRFDIEVITRKLGLNRNTLIAISVLIGCDYLPKGVPGVGKESILQLVQIWKDKMIKNPIERVKSWKSLVKGNESISKKKSADIEETIMKKAVVIPGFPYEHILNEFSQTLCRPTSVTNYRPPKLLELVRWCNNMLTWEYSYAVEKVVPFVTHWMISHPTMLIEPSLRLLRIVKKRVRNGIRCYSVEWSLPDCLLKLAGREINVIETIEDAEHVSLAHSDQVVEFENSKKTKTKRKTNRKKSTKESNHVESSVPADVNLDSSYSDSVCDLTQVIEKMVELKVKTTESQSSLDNSDIICLSDNDDLIPVKQVKNCSERENYPIKTECVDQFNFHIESDSEKGELKKPVSILCEQTKKSTKVESHPTMLSQSVINQFSFLDETESEEEPLVKSILVHDEQPKQPSERQNWQTLVQSAVIDQWDLPEENELEKQKSKTHASIHDKESKGLTVTETDSVILSQSVINQLSFLNETESEGEKLEKPDFRLIDSLVMSPPANISIMKNTRESLGDDIFDSPVLSLAERMKKRFGKNVVDKIKQS